MEFTLAPQSLDAALDDLSLRFLVNLPPGQLEIVDRLFFQLQQAHWYYLDFFVEFSHTLPKLSFRDFSRAMFEHCPLLRGQAHRFEELREQFKDYMSSIPVYGSILLNRDMTRVLMIRPYKGKHWVFPKGKVNEGEEPIECAAREALEEVGYNPIALLKASGSEYLAIRGSDADKPVHFYIGVGAPDDGSVSYHPLTRAEVSEIGWFEVDALPEDPSQPKSNKFWTMLSLIRPLKNWIANRRAMMAPAAGKKKKAAASKAALGPPPSTAKKAKKGASASASYAAGDSLIMSAIAGAGLADPLNTALEDDSGYGGGGGGNPKSWSVSDMFAANERLLGKRFVYDGNPHTFGDDAQQALDDGTALPGAAAPGYGKLRERVMEAYYGNSSSTSSSSSSGAGASGSGAGGVASGGKASGASKQAKGKGPKHTPGPPVGALGSSTSSSLSSPKAAKAAADIDPRVRAIVERCLGSDESAPSSSSSLGEPFSFDMAAVVREMGLPTAAVAR